MKGKNTALELQMPRDAAHSGDRAHFLRVFLTQRSQMEALVSRRVGCRATAADLVQDLFLRFWRRPLVQVEELSTYLLRCAGNIAIDHLRSEGARGRVNEGWWPEQPDSQGSEPQAALEAGNDLRHVEAALCALPERTRHIFLRNRIHGRTYAEIAKAMGVSQSAVEKHMMRALEACKACLREPEPRTPGKAP
jgi:RNA polymerase sigma-70 factor (ECF subfamily)